MKTLNQASRMLLILSLVTGLAYPLFMTLLGSVVFPNRANGSLLISGGRIIGSSLIGQKFISDRYFWPRPSATNYNTLPSGGTNLGPTSAALKDSIEVRRAVLLKDNPGENPVPPDLLHASGSGLDPDISPEAARFQIDRIVGARGLDNDGKIRLIALVEKYIEQPDFGILGESRVNVLMLNLALDSTFAKDNP